MASTVPVPVPVLCFIINTVSTYCNLTKNSRIRIRCFLQRIRGSVSVLKSVGSEPQSLPPRKTDPAPSK
jgi:hypothetical protein